MCGSPQWVFPVRITAAARQLLLLLHQAENQADTKTGLLPLLKSIQRPTELKQHAGETFAVDAYGWLHRGSISCAIELAQGKPTQKYVELPH
jgi:hypothetical protein